MARPIARTLEDAYRACEPDRPLSSDHPYYEDLTPGRGDHSVASLLRRFNLHQPAEEDEDASFVRVAFLSHRGAGKTTELNQLSAQLRHRFHSIHLSANTKLHEQDIDAEDLLFAVAVSVEEDARERGAPLPADVVQRVGEWFVEVVKTTTWAKGIEWSVSAPTLPLFTRVTEKIGAVFRYSADHRVEVRQALRRQPTALVEAVNQLLAAARVTLESEGRDLVVVIDNLDRYPPNVAKNLLIDQSAMVHDLKCHLIVTPPISLHYQPDGEPLERYNDVEVMNTVRLRSASEPYSRVEDPGRAVLVRALNKRLDVTALIPDSTDVDRLLAASGGAMRDLLALIQRVVLVTPAGPGGVLRRDAIERAIANVKTDIRDRVNVNGWAETLAYFARHKQPPAEPHAMTVLFQRLALKYNGTGWYDVHPLVAELPEIQALIQPDAP